MRAPEIERWLDDLDVGWAYLDTLLLAAVDERASMRNQARFEALDRETVDRYADDMRRGDQFPAVIVRAKGKAFVILGGNHRYAAAKAARVPSLDAYVVDCSDETALRISYEDNRRHGKTPTAAERAAHAVHLVTLGWTQAAAAQVVGVSQTTVSNALAVQAFAQRCTAVGLKPRDGLADSTKARLMNVKLDAAFGEAVRLTADAALGGNDVGDLVAKLNKARSEGEALDLLREAREEATERIRRNIADDGRTGQRVAGRQSARARLLRVLSELATIDPADVKASTLPDQRAHVRDKLTAAGRKIIALDGAVK